MMVMPKTTDVSQSKRKIKTILFNYIIMKAENSRTRHNKYLYFYSQVNKHVEQAITITVKIILRYYRFASAKIPFLFFTRLLFHLFLFLYVLNFTSNQVDFTDCQFICRKLYINNQLLCKCSVLRLIIRMSQCQINGCPVNRQRNCISIMIYYN